MLLQAITSIMGMRSQERAADRAASAQTEAAQADIDERRRQFDALQALLKPYSDVGAESLQAQRGLMGLGGPQAQQQALAAITDSPEFAEYMRQGENAMLQNAAATGGLRGGNTQAALMRFRPTLLNQLMQQRFQNLGGLTSVGQNAAAGTGNAGMQLAAGIGGALQQQGAAQAGAALAKGQAGAQMWQGFGNMINQGVGMAASMGKIF